MKELILLKNNDVFTTSLVIAEGTGNEHESVVSLIKKYVKDFECFGRIEFTDLKSGKTICRMRGRKSEPLQKTQYLRIPSPVGKAP